MLPTHVRRDGRLVFLQRIKRLERSTASVPARIHQVAHEIATWTPQSNCARKRMVSRCLRRRNANRHVRGTDLCQISVAERSATALIMHETVRRPHGSPHLFIHIDFFHEFQRTFELADPTVVARIEHPRAPENSVRPAPGWRAQALRYEVVSIWLGISWMFTSKRSCTLFKTAASASPLANVTARPLVPKRPARPTR